MYYTVIVITKNTFGVSVMIGKIIQQKRREIGLTQAQLADRLGVTAPAVNRWEKDLSFPDATLLAPLARCLKTDLNELFAFYDSLSAKERELIVDKARVMIINDEIDDAITHIEAAVKENLSDGALYKDLADMLLGMHTLRQPGDPSIFLERIANYYERALELLPEKTDDISYSLITVYGKLGNAEKAEEAWARLEYVKHDKKWAHAELLYLMKDYDRAVIEIKELVLRKIFDLSRGLTFLHDALSFTGNTELADLAVETDVKLQDLFGLWRGLDIINRASSAIASVPGDTEEVKLAELISNGVSQETLSTSPLFSDVKLGGLPVGEGTSVDLMADILNAIKKLK